MLHVYVRSKAVRVASALRRYYQLHGVVLAPASESTAASHALELVVREERKHPWMAVAIDPPDAFEEDLAAFLSSELSCDVAVVAGVDGHFGVRRWTSGSVVDRLNRVDGNVADDSGGTWLRPARGQSQVAALLEELGLAPAVVDGSASAGRAVVLHGAAKVGKGPEVEVDPLLACPTCHGPMVSRQSRHGTFYGCMRYPDCRGVLSAAQAEALRQSHRLDAASAESDVDG